MKRTDAPSRRPSHPDAGDLLDYSEKKSSAASRSAIRTHLEGCRTCRKSLEDLEKLRDRIPGRHLETTPDWLAAWADDVPALEPRRKAGKKVLPIRLVFDSWKAAPAAARSALTAPRRLVFRAGGEDVDLEIETLSPGFVRIHGQILSGTRKEGAARILSGSRALAVAKVTDDGRFRFERLPIRKSCSLRIDRAGARLEIPDLDL